MPIPKTSSPLVAERVFLQDTIYDALHEAIVSGVLAPNAPLSDTHVTEMYGVTRAPARAALQRLASDGLLIVQPQVGSRVRPVTRKSTLDALAVYRRITEASARVATELLTRVDIETLRERAAAVAEAAPGGDALLAVDEFYDVMLERSGNRVMQRIHTQIAMRLRQAAAATAASGLSHPSLKKATSAAAKGDVDGVLAAIGDHFVHLRERLLAGLPDDDGAVGEGRTADRTFLRDQTYFAIRDAIANGTLTPGEHLRAEELIEWLGVSRAPIRDALARLSDDGLVDMAANRYTRVAFIDEGELAQALVTQLVLFRTAIEESADHLGPEHTARLTALADAAVAAIDDEQGAAVIMAELGTYIQALAEIADNSLLLHLIRQVGPRVSRALALPGGLTDPGRLKTYFLRVHTAVLAGKPALAGDLLREFAGDAIDDIRQRARKDATN